MSRLAAAGLLVLALSASGAAQAQSAAAEPVTASTQRLPKDAARPAAKIGAAAWLAGQYGGTGLGREVEYQWLPPGGGQMYGSFRLLQEGKTRFAQILQLAEVDGSLVLRVKHFSVDFVGWEEKDKSVDFKLNEVRAIGVRAEGVRAEGVRAEGVRAEGVRAEGVRAEGVRVDELRFDGLTLRRTAEGIRIWLAMRTRPAGADQDAPPVLREQEMVLTRLVR
jgi:hypothetical protein